MKYYLISITVHSILFLCLYISFPYVNKVLPKENTVRVSLVSTAPTNDNFSDTHNPISIEKKVKTIDKNINIVKKKRAKLLKKQKIIKTQEKKPSKNPNIDSTTKKSTTSTSETLNINHGLIKDSTDSYIGDINQNSDINYKILVQKLPKYPPLAKKMGYKKDVIIRTKFLIGIDGKVEKIIFLNDFNSYGFREEVKKAIKHFKFEPVMHKGMRIKLYFYKDYSFSLSSKK